MALDEKIITQAIIENISEAEKNPLCRWRS
jgi:hypothetical protein